MSETGDAHVFRDERHAVVERFRALPIADAWLELRAAFEDTPRRSDGTFYVFESAPRGQVLTPLARELLNAFVFQHGNEAMDILYKHINDTSPAVAAYSLIGVFEAGGPTLADAARSVAHRTERVQAVDGCFAWSGTLAEYASRLYDEYIALSEDHSPDPSPEEEAEWRRAQFDELAGKIMTGKTRSRHPFSEYAQLATLAARIRQIDVLRHLLDVTRRLVDDMPSSSRIIIAETLVGRDSPIEVARALGDLTLARDFATLVPAFCGASDTPPGGKPMEPRRASVFARLKHLVGVEEK